MSNPANKRVMEELANCLDIPESAYDKAEARYDDLGKWFSRKEAHCAPFSPHIYPQGSFRVGTVVNFQEYDLDLGCRLRVGISKTSHTQQQLKELVRLDLEAYRSSRGIDQQLEEKNRCWRLRYRDELAFHMDAVPSIPEEEQQRVRLAESMVKHGLTESLAEDVADLAGAITDTRSPYYTELTWDWKISNSEGYARWFESRMKLNSQLIIKLAEFTKVATIDDLPARKWKTPLQFTIQILKCHANRMFEDSLESRPISIIITTLAAEAYQGEQDVTDALEGILSRMDAVVHKDRPRVPNPVNPLEDFADKWYDAQYKHLNLEENFWKWLRQARADFQIIQDSHDADFIVRQAMTKFGARMSPEGVKAIVGVAAPAAVANPKVHRIEERPAEPWLRD